MVIVSSARLLLRSMRFFVVNGGECFITGKGMRGKHSKTKRNLAFRRVKSSADHLSTYLSVPFLGWGNRFSF